MPSHGAHTAQTLNSPAWGRKNVAGYLALPPVPGAYVYGLSLSNSLPRKQSFGRLQRLGLHFGVSP